MTIRTSGGGASNRQDRRKAATRGKILSAAERLFGQQGYDQTSIDDISEAADVAVRTIYMHFPSKAAIMLAGFDAWVDQFVAAVLGRPVEEPVLETVRAVLEELETQGWEDHSEVEGSALHPMVAHLYNGSPDIAGHVLQRWMHEIERIARDAIERSDYPAGSLEPHARALAMFAAWIGALSTAGGRGRGIELPAEASGHSLGLSILQALTRGDL